MLQIVKKIHESTYWHSIEKYHPIGTNLFHLKYALEKPTGSSLQHEGGTEQRSGFAGLAPFSSLVQLKYSLLFQSKKPFSSSLKPQH